MVVRLMKIRTARPQGRTHIARQAPDKLTSPPPQGGIRSGRPPTPGTHRRAYPPRPEAEAWSLPWGAAGPANPPPKGSEPRQRRSARRCGIRVAHPRRRTRAGRGNGGDPGVRVPSGGHIAHLPPRDTMNAPNVRVCVMTKRGAAADVGRHAPASIGGAAAGTCGGDMQLPPASPADVCARASESDLLAGFTA